MPRLHIFNISMSAPLSGIFMTVCAIDVIYYILAFAMPLYLNNAQRDHRWPRTVWLLSAATFMICSAKATYFMWEFEMDKGSGNIREKATKYLHFRKMILVLYLTQAIVIPLLIIGNEGTEYFFVFIRSQKEYMDIRVTKMTRALADGIIYFLGCIVSHWLLTGFQRSFKEAIECTEISQEVVTNNREPFANPTINV